MFIKTIRLELKSLGLLIDMIKYPILFISLFLPCSEVPKILRILN